MYSFYYMKAKRVLAPAFICFFTLSFILFSMLAARTAQEALSGSLSSGILRFHVLANSNSSADQAVKQEVFRTLLSSIKNGTKEEGITHLTKENLQAYIRRHRSDLEKTAENVLAAHGFSYSASVRLERCYFSTRQYAGLTFPCGTYDAVRVLLGEGSGKNWWCVLYPPLSFSGSGAVEQTSVPTEAGEEPLRLVPGDQYEWMTGKKKILFGNDSPEPAHIFENIQNDDTTTIRIKSRLWEFLTEKK